MKLQFSSFKPFKRPKLAFLIASTISQMIFSCTPIFPTRIYKKKTIEVGINWNRNTLVEQHTSLMTSFWAQLRLEFVFTILAKLRSLFVSSLQMESTENRIFLTADVLMKQRANSLRLMSHSINEYNDAPKSLSFSINKYILYQFEFPNGFIYRDEWPKKKREENIPLVFFGLLNIRRCTLFGMFDSIEFHCTKGWLKLNNQKYDWEYGIFSFADCIVQNEGGSFGDHTCW